MFYLRTLIPAVTEALRTVLREGIAANEDTDEPAIPGLNELLFVVRQGAPGQPDFTQPAAVIFADDPDPVVPFVRLTVDDWELPEAFDMGETIRVKWRVMADCLAATKAGSRAATVTASTAEAQLASAVMAILLPQRTYIALEEIGIEGLTAKSQGLKSRDNVFRYPTLIEFETSAFVSESLSESLGNE